jgi:hypothetical protein
VQEIVKINKIQDMERALPFRSREENAYTIPPSKPPPPGRLSD